MSKPKDKMEDYIDVRVRRLDTAKIVLQCLLDSKEETADYICYLDQLKKIKNEYDIHHSLKKPKVFYPQSYFRGAAKYIIRRLDMKFKGYLKS